jgi:hypothetical protein
MSWSAQGIRILPPNSFPQNANEGDVCYDDNTGEMKIFISGHWLQFTSNNRTEIRKIKLMQRLLECIKDCDDTKEIVEVLDNFEWLKEVIIKQGIKEL